ncbi:MAG: 3-deoxy-manno-octulosonate cytidylyltransferase [Bacteroides sp.]|jgi:3-deoxy-manno-octulosonate cytidylyltransferase (CMP-KDO synthetase)|nr:3-deoxy-manno-octulosonate cytidylyltransferase [Bacteroides sp.]
MKYIGIIPARYASTRFPGKPLAMIGNKSMIRRVYEQAIQCKQFDKVVVATDDERILNHVLQFGEAVMTASNHRSGTDRCLEATSLISGEQEIGDGDVVINIQGDEPFIQPEQIELLASLFSDPETLIGTLVKRINQSDDLFNPNIVKVVFDRNFRALYFSRWAIPFIRGAELDEWLNHHRFFRHIGLYGYRLGVLKKLASLPFGELEKAESLEQLRWLQHGFPIKVMETDLASPGIDTPEDLESIPPQWL